MLPLLRLLAAELLSRALLQSCCGGRYSTFLHFAQGRESCRRRVKSAPHRVCLRAPKYVWYLVYKDIISASTLASVDDDELDCQLNIICFLCRRILLYLEGPLVWFRIIDEEIQVGLHIKKLLSTPPRRFPTPTTATPCTPAMSAGRRQHHQ